MSRQILNTGNAANDGLGDTLRDASEKINDNFLELYTKLEAGGQILLLRNDVFTGDGTTTTFTLSDAALNPSLLQITVDGILQEVSSYSIAAEQLLLSEAPPVHSVIEVRSFIASEVNSTDLVNIEYVGNGVLTQYDLPQIAIKPNTFIHVDGIYQVKSAYTVESNVLTFSEAPPLGSLIEVTIAAFLTTTLTYVSPLSVYTGAIQDLAVTTAKIVDANVTTVKIADGAITSAKLGAGVGGAYNDFVIKTTAYTAVTRDQIIVNSSSAVTITLPITPSSGNVVFIKNAGTGEVTVGRNGSNINSTADDGTLAADAGASLVYVDGTIGWKEL